MNDNKNLNGETKPEETQSDEKLVTKDVVQEFLGQKFREISATLPDYKFTLIGHDMRPGVEQHIVLSEDNPNWIKEFIANAVAHVKETSQPH